MTANRAVLDYASRHREQLLYNIWLMGHNAIERGNRDSWTITPKVVEAAQGGREAAAQAAARGGRRGGGGGRWRRRWRRGGPRGSQRRRPTSNASSTTRLDATPGATSCRPTSRIS